LADAAAIAPFTSLQRGRRPQAIGVGEPALYGLTRNPGLEAHVGQLYLSLGFGAEVYVDKAAAVKESNKALQSAAR